MGETLFALRCYVWRHTKPHWYHITPGSTDLRDQYYLCYYSTWPDQRLTTPDKRCSILQLHVRYYNIVGVCRYGKYHGPGTVFSYKLWYITTCTRIRAFYILSALVGDHGHVCYLLSFWYKIPNCPLSYQLYFLMILFYSWLFWFDAVTQHLFIRNVGTMRGGGGHKLDRERGPWCSGYACLKSAVWKKQTVSSPLTRNDSILWETFVTER